MNISKGEKSFFSTFNLALPRVLIFVGCLFVLLPLARALSVDPGSGGSTNSSPVYVPLDSWSFQDYTNWTSDKGYVPVSFNNLAHSYLGNGYSLVVSNADAAWLRYNVVETNGATNLTINAGTVMFWFASSWSGTDQGGDGPGEYGRLLEAGSYTSDSSLGWWSIYVDDGGNNLYFSAQTNDLSGTFTNYLSVPIAWTTNYFHFVALTYSATNTALYLDGVLATNGPGVTVYPGQDALANGFYIGSDSNGVNQAQGLFNNVVTYNVPLDTTTIQSIFSQEYGYYMMSPWNTAMFKLFSASSSPSFTSTSYSAITGAGNLQWIGNTSDCIDGTNAMQVWFTNVIVTASSNGTENVTFTIEGGLPGYAYDVFATAALQSPITNSIWVWLGQGYQCTTYTVNIPSVNALLVLGTPQDSNGDGVTDAYSDLIGHIDPSVAQSDAYGVPYAWYIQNGLSVSSALLDPDFDGLLNYQEYFYGTRPQVSEGFGIWTTGNNSSIP